MLTYVLIALGGAIGSVGRAWLGAAMVTWTGPSFPWGTLLINVLGSFVIGFFATLTATDGRFPIAADWRAFVMIGICGGFTTFSSFSLQSFDLLRDGRPAQALGNVALSVLLCLGAVALGYAGAQATRLSPLASLEPTGRERPGHAILALLHDPRTAARQLNAASLLLSRGAGGHITVLAIDEPMRSTFLPTEELLTTERRNEIAAQRQNWTGTLREMFAVWQQGPGAQGITTRWIDTRRDSAQAIVEHARRAHLLLLERQGDPGEAARLHAALARSGRPLLLMPPEGGLPFGRIIAIAWKDDASARAAIRSAAPLLAQAERLVVLRLGPARDAAPPPLPAGVPVGEPDAGADDGRSDGTRLLAMAHAAGADMLVMGGLPHGSAREALLGGVTRHVLKASDLPVLMQHDRNFAA
jgi:protein CrcB